jgi:hypothetical protein
VLLAGADDVVRDSAGRLEDWAIATGATGRNTSSARDFAAPDGRTLCRLYPKLGWSCLEVDLKAARELGGDEDADALLAIACKDVSFSRVRRPSLTRTLRRNDP